jgi:hypothetical protein
MQQMSGSSIAYASGGHSNHDCTRRYILDYQWVCSYSRVIANRDLARYHRAGTNTNPIPKRWHPTSQPLSCHPQRDALRNVAHLSYLHVLTHEYIAEMPNAESSPDPSLVGNGDTRIHFDELLPQRQQHIGQDA